MARVTYGLLGAAGAALVAGFFVKHSSLPLFISLAFSVAVFALLMYGNARRARTDEFGEADEPPVEELGPDEVEALKKKPAADETASMDTLDDDAFAPPPRKRVARKIRPKAKPTPTPAPAPEPSKPKASKAKPKAAAAQRSKPAKRKPASKRVAVVPGAARYHKPSCRFAQSPGIRMVSEAIAKERGYVPCGTCKP